MRGMATAKLALVGDRSPSVRAHGRIPLLIDALRRRDGIVLDPYWIPSTEADDLEAFDGIWVVPGSPYTDPDKVVAAVKTARERQIPFLGTCGGFQHAILEHARHVMDWPDAMHAESDPGVGRPVISALQCSLVEARGSVTLAPGSRIAQAYAASTAPTIYRCRYGPEPRFRAALLSGPLRVAAEDEHGDVRAVELERHPFFVATLWQPERAALEGQRVPLAEALVTAARRA
jgi:CTP synthase (UTP-ammonia lyase)